MPSAQSYESSLLEIFAAKLPDTEELQRLQDFRADYLQQHSRLDYARLVLRITQAYQGIIQIDDLTPEDFHD